MCVLPPSSPSGMRPWWQCVVESKAWPPRRSELCPRKSCRCLWPWRTSPSPSRRSPSLSLLPTWKNTKPGWPSLGQYRERCRLDPEGPEAWKEDSQLWEWWKPWRGGTRECMSQSLVCEAGSTSGIKIIQGLNFTSEDWCLWESMMRTFSGCPFTYSPLVVASTQLSV